MKKQKMNLAILTVAITVAALSQLGAAVQPAPAATSSTPAATTAVKAVPFHGKVIKVNKTSRTFTVQIADKSRLFTVDAKTKLMKDAAKASFDQIAVGELVRGSGTRISEGKYDAVSVIISPAIQAKTTKTLATKAPKLAAQAASPAPAAAAATPVSVSAAAAPSPAP